MLGLLPFQGVVYLLNQYHRALPWAKSKLCPFRAQADKTIFRKAQQAKASHRTDVNIKTVTFMGFDIPIPNFINSTIDIYDFPEKIMGNGINEKMLYLCSFETIPPKIV